MKHFNLQYTEEHFSLLDVATLSAVSLNPMAPPHSACMFQVFLATFILHLKYLLESKALAYQGKAGKCFITLVPGRR